MWNNDIIVMLKIFGTEMTFTGGFAIYFYLYLFLCVIEGTTRFIRRFV